MKGMERIGWETNLTSHGSGLLHLVDTYSLVVYSLHLAGV